MLSALEHATTKTVIAVRSLTAVGVVDGKDRDKDRDIRVVVAHRVVVLGDEADLVPMVVISVASRVTARSSPTKITFIIRGHS